MTPVSGLLDLWCFVQRRLRGSVEPMVSTGAGWAGVLVAFVCWGSFTSFTKTKKMQAVKVDPILIQARTACPLTWHGGAAGVVWLRPATVALRC